MLLLAVCALALVSWRTAHRRNEGDLRVYYETVGRLSRGLDLYQRREGPDPQRPTGFIYPPLFAVFFWPLTALPFPLLRGLWCFATGLCALRAFVLAHDLLRRERPPPPRAGLALAAGALVALRFVWSDLGHGQANLVVIWLTLEGIVQAARGRELLGGALIATATLFKLTPAIVVAGYLVRGRRRVVLGALLGGLIGLLLPALVLGPLGNLDALWRFATVVTSWNDAQHGYVGNNASLTSALQRLLVGVADAGQRPAPLLLSLPPGPVRILCALLSLASLAGSLALARTVRGEAARSAVLLAAIPLVSPVAWKPHLVCLVLPALFAAEAVTRRGLRRAWPLALALGLLGLSGRLVLGRAASDAFLRWGGLTGALVLLAGALALAAREEEGTPAPPPPSSSADAPA